MVIQSPYASKFQFQYGTIKSRFGNYRLEIGAKFQFQYGTIKRNIAVLKHQQSLSFNSSMVRLKDLRKFCRSGAWPSFNSSMVRLKGVHIQWRSLDNQFQFQYGTIKSNLLFNKLRQQAMFQFQYGTIKRKSSAQQRKGCLCFNSSMVRLKALQGSISSSQMRFQFQYGTIKRKDGVWPETAGIQFQFQYGTIKSYMTLRLLTIIRVSIPVWYD